MSPITSALSSIVAQPAGLAATDPAPPGGPSFGAALDALSALALGLDKTARPVVAAPGPVPANAVAEDQVQPTALGKLPDLVAQVSVAAVAPVAVGVAPKPPSKPAADDAKPVKTIEAAAPPTPLLVAITPLLPAPILPLTIPSLPATAAAAASPDTAVAPAGLRPVATAPPATAATPAALHSELQTEAMADKGAAEAATMPAAAVAGSPSPAGPHAVASDPVAPLAPAPITPAAAAPVLPAPAIMAPLAAAATPQAPAAGGKSANAPIGTGGMRVTSVQQTILHAAPDGEPSETAAEPTPALVDPAAIIPAGAPAAPQAPDTALTAGVALPPDNEKKAATAATTDGAPVAAVPLETRQAADVAAPAAAAKAVDHPAPAEQIAPALTAMMTGRSDAGHRLSITLAPEQLGSVGITIERVADGSTTIHVTAERLETLHLLQQDQADLTRSLDQAGVAPEHRTLSFSWSGEGGQSTWSGQGQGQSQGQGYTPNHRAYAAAYNDDQPVLTPRRSLDAGSVDITA